MPCCGYHSGLTDVTAIVLEDKQVHGCQAEDVTIVYLRMAVEVDLRSTCKDVML